MEKLTDDVVAVSIVQETKQNYARLRSVSMAKGFHGTDNQAGLKEIVEWVVMPSQGRLSAVDRAREDDPEAGSAGPSAAGDGAVDASRGRGAELPISPKQLILFNF